MDSGDRTLICEAMGQRLELGTCLFFRGTRNWIPAAAAADRLASDTVAWFLSRAPEGWEVPGALYTP